MKLVGTRHQRRSAGFTLIELMVVIGMILIMFTVGIPTFAKAHNQRPMKVATEQLMEVLSTARAQAIVRGVTVELRMNPQEYTFDVSASGPSTELDQRVAEGADAFKKGRFNMKLPDDIGIELLDVNYVPYKDEDSATLKFFSNGTSQEFTVVIRSITGEYRKISVEPITARAEYEILQ